jgi:hypothetical protein
LIGAFNAAEAPALLAACEKCPPHLIDHYGGQDYFKWGPGDQQNLRLHRQVPPSFDHIGRPGEIVVTDDHVFRALKHPDLELLIDTDSGAATSLLLDEQYKAIARTLGAGGAVSAILTDQSFDADTVINGMCGLECLESQEKRGQLQPGTADRIRASISESGPLEPFGVMGAGLGIDEVGAFALVALSYDTADIATNAANQLEARIEIGNHPDIVGDGENQSFLDRISEFEVTTSGSIVLAKFRTPTPKELRDFTLFARSSNAGNAYLYNRFVLLITTE